jgi:ParB family chromosome partitioning protein
MEDIPGQGRHRYQLCVVQKARGPTMSTPKTQIIMLSRIVVQPDRMRALRPDLVDELAASIDTEGLLQPIVVRPDPKGAGFFLVAGRHRLEAMRKLKHETIECRVLEGLSADQARVAEIDENLIRADLTPSERAAHHAERKALYLKLHPETQQGGSREGAGRPKRDGKKAKSNGQNGPLKKDAYTKDAAKKTGKSSRTIKREVARGENIDPQVLSDLAGTCLDNGTELDALARLSAAEQRSLAEAAKRGDNVSAITTPSVREPEESKVNDGTEEIELGNVIARLRRNQPRNPDTMRVCDALEHRLKSGSR